MPSAIPQVDYSTSWLPSTPQLVRGQGAYPQNLLRPSAKGCADCTSSAYRVGFDSRRNLAGLGMLSGGGFGALGLGRLGTITDGQLPSWWMPAMAALGAVGAGAAAYHGYRRNRGSVGWAIVWGLLGGAFPIITVPVALAEGYAKPAKR